MTNDQKLAYISRSNRFAALMNKRAAQYPAESYHDRFMRCSKSPEGAAIWEEAERAKRPTQTQNAMMAANSYDASQPRDPAGTSTGGQWTGGGSDAEALAKADAAIERVEDGKGSMEFFHGTHRKNPEVHVGQTYADNQRTADNYSSKDTFRGEVNLDGLKVAHVKRFNRDDINYGALGDSDRDIAALRRRGIDMLKYEDEDPENRQHTAYRIVSDKALGRFKSAMKLASQEE